MKIKLSRNLLAVLYLIIILALSLFKLRFFWTPDILMAVLLGFFIILGQAKRFLMYFSPFLVLLLSYDKLRSLAPIINSRVHYMEMVHIDRWMFGGTLPTTSLQQIMYFGHVAWYDFYFYGLYMLHFIAPILLAVVIWKYRPKAYTNFIAALLILSYAGFITYVIFPAAPPWLASELGMIEPIHRISSDVWAAFGVKDFSLYYKKLAPNAVAAVPSLHAAYPLLFTLAIRNIWGIKWFLLSLIYPFSVGFGVIYLGEHYIIDVILGYIYAVLAWIAAPSVVRFASKQISKFNERFFAKSRKLSIGKHD